MDFLSTFQTTYILPTPSLDRETNLINLNKLNTLKHESNAEIMKTWFLYELSD